MFTAAGVVVVVKLVDYELGGRYLDSRKAHEDGGPARTILVFTY